MIKVLFVCMGNICRSPTAQAVFTGLLHKEDMAWSIHVDSAGTHAYHVGAAPDLRAAEAALERGIDMGDQSARIVEGRDFIDFDYILAMDSDNYNNLIRICPPEHQHKVHRMLDFAQEADSRDVPDPYYGGASGFERVLDLVEMASAGLLRDIQQRYADRLS